MKQGTHILSHRGGRSVFAKVEGEKLLLIERRISEPDARIFLSEKAQTALKELL